MMDQFLSIGWDLKHPKIREADFFEGPSFASFDGLFVDPKGISEYWIHDLPSEKDGGRRTYTTHDRGFGRILSRLIAKRRSETSDFLYRAGGILVCRMYPRGESLEIITQELPGERIDRYSWLPTVSLVDRQHQLVFPANSRFLARRGDDILFEGTGNPFEGYLREFKGKIVYQAAYQDLLSTPIDHFATVLARNKVGDVVALEIPFEEGRLVLLPRTEGISPAREAAALMDAMSTSILRPAFFADPDWLSAYPLSGEEALRDEYVRLTDRQAKLKSKIEELSSQLQEKTRYKRVLYTKGRFSFFPAVADSFRALGFEVEGSGDTLILRSEEGDALCVAEAAEGTTIGLVPYRQLLASVDRTRTEEEAGPKKGILVVSGSRELDPKRRPTQFTPEVLRGCQSQGFCLLTSYELFKLVQYVLKEKDQKEMANIRRTLLESDGEFRGIG
jgi:hypothetical protein